MACEIKVGAQGFEDMRTGGFFYVDKTAFVRDYPWSVTKFLESGGQVQAWWANTSSNALVSAVVRQGDEEMKADFETLLQGGTVEKVIDEQVVFSELTARPNAAAPPGALRHRFALAFLPAG